ncbi:MAG: glycoside hydrolase family 127 protein [Clostridia bacterium]|nr:glycoside hydrolase family 127 protein [Clostridia bacterium]
MYKFYTSKQLKPNGWLLKQLKIQAEGLSGNLDKVWPDVRDSGWVGGTAEGWERLPYWLDGFIPLAYLLENDELISRAKKYVDHIIAKQKPSGWICPCDEDKISTYDPWVIYLISKVLIVYYDCSGDERIKKVVYDILKNLYDLLSSGALKLFGWGRHRWFECFIGINFIKEHFNEPWIDDLAKLVKAQGADYNEFIPQWKRPLNKWTFDTHIVNLVMMLKQEAVSCDILGNEYTDLAEKLYDVLYKYNGTPVGLFTGDECLSGLSPIQGTELCAVVDQMYSFEHLYAYTGDPKWAERIEVLAFNALPATISDDMWTHQYDQMSNQIACIRFPGKSLFRTNNNEAHIFGLEPSYGCCTSNLHQGWPKFALSAFMHDGDTVVNVFPVPSELNDNGISISLETNYPFENTFTYKIKSDRPFKFKVRIPSFAENITVNGDKKEKCSDICFDIEQNSDMTINISFDTVPYFVNRPYGLKNVKCGSLVFSLPIKYDKVMYEYTRNNVERKFPYCDYEYVGKSDWNYGFSDGYLSVERHPVADIPFSSESPAVTIKAKFKKIDWGFEDGYDSVCAKIPGSTKPIGEEETIDMYPYGCAKLRMTEMPFVEE